MNYICECQPLMDCLGFLKVIPETEPETQPYHRGLPIRSIRMNRENQHPNQQSRHDINQPYSYQNSNIILQPNGIPDEFDFDELYSFSPKNDNLTTETNSNFHHTVSQEENISHEDSNSWEHISDGSFLDY